MAYKPRGEAPKYKVQKGDTIKAIAAKHKISGETLSVYNWGTQEVAQVKRALVEAVGVQGKIDDPQSFKFTGKEKDAGSGEILIPEAWSKTGCNLDKLYTLKLKKNTPATAVAITCLDKWFIPQAEACDLQYTLEGAKENADKLLLEVYGSNYCGCSDWNKGLGKFDPKLPDDPVYKEDLAKQAAPKKAAYPLPEKWRGKTNTEKGFFSVKTEKTGPDGKKTKADRFINAAFSPYTVHMRYYKADGDKTARIDLKPFWPRFEETKAEPAVTSVVAAKIKIKWTNAADADRGAVLISDKNGQRVYFGRLKGDQLKKGAQEVEWDRKYRAGAMDSLFKGRYNAEPDAGKNKDAPYTYQVVTFTRKPKADSFKAEWEIKDTDKLKLGLLQIFDGKDRLIFQTGLKPGDHLTKGKHSFQWPGKYNQEIKSSKNGDDAIYEDMPYRIQLQAHTPSGEPEGLALAAMHTEVRLYVHPQANAPQDPLYDAWEAAPGMHLALAPLVPGDPPAEGDGTKWFRYKLAAAGFHPGPVTDDAAAADAYKIALKEFKRSVPKDGSAGGTNFTRLAIDENEDGDTKTAIKTLRVADQRKWFGDPARVLGNNDNPDLTDDEIKTRIGDPAREVILWVDDRQYYTNKTFVGSATPPPPTKDKDGAEYLTSPFNLDDHRGSMNIGDARVDKDSTSIARPWIPLQVAPTLVSRKKGLFQEPDALAGAEKEKVLAATQAAIGPLRIDWTFDELPPDLSTLDPAGIPNYDKDFVRSRIYAAWALDQNKADYTRKDTNRKAQYTNCREDFGGIRPKNDPDLKKYYSKAFGTGKLMLEPWQAANVDDTESVATVVHDFIAKGQKEKTDLFSKLIGSAGIYFVPSTIAGDGYRLRAEVQFKEFADYKFPNLEALAARYPTPPQTHTARLRAWRKSTLRGYMCWGPATGNWGNVFINAFRAQYRAAHVYFVHEGGASQSFNINAILTQDTYKKIIAKNVTLAALQDEAKVTLNANDVWPWTNQNDFGWPDPIAVVPGLTYENCREEVLNQTWRKFRSGLILTLLKEVERQGRMRGHLFVEFDHNSACCFQLYRCNNAGPHHFIYLEKGAPPGSRMDNQPCPAPGCGTTGKKLTHMTGGGTSHAMNGLSLPAVGAPLGATWLFWRGENANRLRVVWVHEVGHHRHLEHAANTGGPANLHDSESNTHYTAWGTKPPPPGSVGTGQADARRWDRRCLMSYSDCWYGELGCLCGRCVLRNRGWKVTALGFPGTAVGEP